jgi:HEPN domain-containing protein
MNIEKQITFWRSGAEEDFEVAKELVEKGRTRHGLFFAHLAVEKLLKAHVVKTTQDIPPKIHNLVRLAQLTGLPISEEMETFFRRLNAYQLDGRYPETTTGESIVEYHATTIIDSAQEVLQWLIQQL